MAQKKDFTIRRNRSGLYERTIVGKTGRTHVMDSEHPGRHGHFTNEGQYRRAIDQAVAQNSR